MTDPLTGGTTGAEDMARSLLRYANRQKVADALIEQGYQTTRATVNRWARGDEMPGIAARMVLALFGHAPDTTKEPPPEWAEAMEQRLRLELERNRSLIEALAPPDIREAAARVIEQLEALPPQGDEALAGADGGEAPGAAAPPGPGPGSRQGRVVG